jgi:divalent metal cation (Fe/Co/Zn/Cd) transporter
MELLAYGISIWILISSGKIFIESYNVLMDMSIDNETKEVILKLISNYEKVKKIEDFYSTPSRLQIRNNAYDICRRQYDYV